MNQEEQRRILEVLQHWHALEFFIPFALDQRLSDLEDWQWCYLGRDALQSKNGQHWLHVDPPADKEVQGFDLYLGVFDASAILDMMRDCLPPAAGNGITDEEEQRAQLEGATCFAKLRLSPQGELQLDRISVSTVPWAIGQVRAGGLGSLSHAAFDAAKQRLISLFNDFMAHRGDRADAPLGAEDILRLHRLLCEWAGFMPDPEAPMAVLEARVRDSMAAPDVAAEVGVVVGAQDAPEASLPVAETAASDTNAGVEADDAEDEAAADTEIDILNSFFLVDLEHAIASVQAGAIPEPLRRYLIPLSKQERIDLYTDAGREELLRALHPRHLNAGHWLSDPEHAMSLMQQFAINTALSELEAGGLFSVNGPPGTGKTTLLRDVFAEILVRRARVLAGLPDAGAAFVGTKRKVQFDGDEKPCYLHELIEPLLGHEMVVASYNNAAIENISVALPKRKEVASPWRDTVRYLQPVAHNLAIKAGKRRNVSPEGEEMPWGLISCALGNSRNRKLFRERFAFASLKTSSEEVPSNFWGWRKQAPALSFSEAAASFRKADQAVMRALSLRGVYADCQARVQQRRPQLESLHRASEQARQDSEQAEKNHSTAQVALARLELESARLQEREQLIRKTRPSWSQWLFEFRTALRRWRSAEAELKANADLQLQQFKAREAQRLEVVAAQEAIASSRAQLEVCRAAEAEVQREQEVDLQQLREMVQVMPLPSLPETPEQLETDVFQISGLWHDPELSQLRSNLFAAAMALHEAWLHEVTQHHGFGSNVVAMTKWLQNKRPQRADDYLSIVRGLFMIVPIVSTTFASFASQFRGLGPDAIGWLFIDEAGQAVPQAAVGALWRARRAVVVGDPLQIEPVFTLPIRLIAALGALSDATAEGVYAPHRTSAQCLADQANRYGTLTTMGDEPLWIGSPLRVHRRCIEPMFGIANRIAYGGKMVYGMSKRHAPDAAPLPLASCWLDIPGGTERKQVVPEQIAFVAGLIVRLYRRDGALPRLYVISPFKAIRQALHDALRGDAWDEMGSGQRPSARALSDWLRASVGTVHTFQGKEQDTVLMVLGADRQHPGSALWASSKPNLLNVALTRAKRRCYLIGDFDLWSPLQHFDATVSGEFPLPRRSASEFLSELDVADMAHAAPR
ncbi:DEAD/DEAH box helicase [Xanthomonas indica]|uniref:AAA domain-containing protein n=1 Tax=Xanthomonas indica TaxID=2912242 RepID=A0AAU8I7T5_9XANT|nr:AAA domain-containing protein [Xanthomonas indica]MCI2261498.1 AAA domain-containing protein [Xanthomonas indica]